MSDPRSRVELESNEQKETTEPMSKTTRIAVDGETGDATVMGAIDGDRYVIADLDREAGWISVLQTAACDLNDVR